MTPETDHLENGLGTAAEMIHPTFWAFTRTLERERDEARDAAKKAKAYKRVLKEANAQLKRERDSWKAAHDNQVELKRIISDRPDLKELSKLVAELIEERDGSRETALQYWIDQSEHCCVKPLPTGSCFACDMLQLERERDALIASLNFHAELNKGLAEQYSKENKICANNAAEIIASQANENIILTHQRDRLAEALERILEYQGSFAEEDPKSIATEALQSLNQTNE